MSKLIKIFLLFVIILSPLQNPIFASGPESLILGNSEGSTAKEPAQAMETPDPTALKLNWWEYFDVKNPPEFAQRIQAESQLLYSQLSRLSGKDLELATSLINNILMHLNAILAAKQQPPLESPTPQPFLPTYTIDQQIELNHKIKLVSIDKKNDEEDLENIKNRIDRMQKHLDSLMVAYLDQNTPSVQKMLDGLEIMANKTALSSAQEQLKQLYKRVEIQKTKLSLLQKELEATKELLNFKDFDPNKLEADIKTAEQELERKQAELLKLENNAYLSTSQNPNEKNLFTQKLIHAAAERALARTKVAFFNLKYNLYMHYNRHFDESHQEMYDKLNDWKEHLDKIVRNAKDWKKVALREQDRVRQEYTTLTSQQETIDNKTLRLNQARRLESLETLSTLQQLEDEVENTYWLINQLENFIRTDSSFMENSWMNFTTAVSKAWEMVDDGLNYTLFKIGELPITILSLTRIAIILTLSIFISKLLRTALMTFGNRRGKVTVSTLYNLGRLIHYSTLIIGLLVALFSIGFDFSNLVLLASALTLGIGFGLQSFANNFICGLRILFERNLKVGDYIELQSGTYGKVTEIHVQNTLICTSDGIEIVVPNSELTNHTLINYTMNNDFRRLTIPFSVASDADKNLIRKIVSEAAKQVPCTAPASKYGSPQVWLKKFDKYTLEFCLVVWVNYKMKSFTDSKEADYLWEIESILQEYKVPLTSNSPTILLAQNNQLVELPLPSES